MRRVVVTGLGAVTPLGIGARHTWNRVLASHNGIVSVSHLQPSSQWAELPSRIAGLVPTGSASEGKWQASDWVGKGEERRMAKFALYAVAATEMALQDAGWKPRTLEECEMVGVCLGSGIGNLGDLVETSLAYHSGVSHLHNDQIIVLNLSGIQESVAALCAQAAHQSGCGTYINEVWTPRPESHRNYSLYNRSTCDWRRFSVYRFR
jgi:3-oxoacyl-(acyl-carrier-protein) synthase